MERKCERQHTGGMMVDWKGTIIVLDDDPTGVQTVHDVCVYTNWDQDSIRDGFMQEENLFFILTNSRSFSQAETVAVHEEITRHIIKVAKELGKEFLIVLRGDSTLRGHTVLEPDTVVRVLEQEMGNHIDGEIFCPCFFECGRITEQDIHYVVEGDRKTPVALTEFAKDKTFGYQALGLREYLEEKTKGQYPAVNCLSVDSGLSVTRSQQVEQLLLQSHSGQKIIVNASSYKQLDAFCECLGMALRAGKRFVVRSSASFVKSMGGIKAIPLLDGSRLRVENGNGGVVLIGSHVEKTTRQLACLRDNLDVEYLEFHTDQILTAGGLEKEAKRVRSEAERMVGSGHDVVIYTSRNVIVAEGMGPEQQLRIAVQISGELTGMIEQFAVAPSYLIAKGGITSSDVGVKGLHVKKARVMGQILPGIPVWLTGEESRFPGMPYIIFPGNVGEDSALLEIVRSLKGQI